MEGLNLNFADPNLWIGFLTLTVLEIVLGIDNVVFISILAAKLPVEQQAKARKLGLGLALITRILLLLTISWIAKSSVGGLNGAAPPCKSSFASAPPVFATTTPSDTGWINSYSSVMLLGKKVGSSSPGAQKAQTAKHKK